MIKRTILAAAVVAAIFFALTGAASAWNRENPGRQTPHELKGPKGDRMHGFYSKGNGRFDGMCRFHGKKEGQHKNRWHRNSAGHYGRFRAKHGQRDYARIPEEIRQKAADMDKLKIDLKMELTKRPIDRNKALELHGQISAKRQEIRDWKFAKKLDLLEKRSAMPMEAPVKPESPAKTEEAPVKE